MRLIRTILRLGAVALACSQAFAATVVFLSPSIRTVTEDAGQAELEVRRRNDITTRVSVDFATADGTAAAGLKYVATSGTILFEPGETNKTIRIPILNDELVGPFKDFQVILSNPTGGAELGLGSPTAATVRINDNDRGFEFEFARYSVDESAGFVQLAVRRGVDGDAPISVEYASLSGSALESSDFAGVTNRISFGAGESIKLFTIPILDDATREQPEGFRVQLRDPVGSVVGFNKETSITIEDNDPGMQFQFQQYWAAENESAISLTVLRGRDTDTTPFTVDYSTVPGTALPDQDFRAVAGTLTFAPGEAANEISIPLLRNESSTADRQFRVTLSSPSTGAILGTNRTATVTLLDATQSQPHSIGSIEANQTGISLKLEGGVHKRFNDLFDLYPVEFSTDLVNWFPLATLVRTNGSTNLLNYGIPPMASPRAFFRTAAGPFITPYRPPTGPYAVGSLTRVVNDPSRRNRYNISTNSSFLINIWYPAQIQAAGPMDKHEHPYELDNVFRRDPFWSVDRTRSMSLPTFKNAPLATTENSYPVVLHSPGAGSGRTELFETGPNLASHGYVVVAMDHISTRITTFPDGSIRYGVVPYADINAVLTDSTFQSRQQDFEAVLAYLTEINQSDPVLSGRLDLTRLATMGFSYGGGNAGEFARVHNRVKAVILRDCYLQNANDLLRFGLQTPVLAMYSTGGGDSALYDHAATSNAIWFIINGSVHSNFSDYSWLLGDLKNVREISRTINDWTLWFLNKNVKGLPETMPDQKKYPRITAFKQK